MLKTIASLFKKPLETASDEITSKFKTPFFSTLLFVWLIKNNIFIYDLFFNSSKADKAAVLNDFFKFGELSFYLNVLYTLLITISVIILFYFILNITRVITMVSEERIKLNLLNLLKSKSIGSIEEVNFWKDKSDSLNESNRKLETDIESLRNTVKLKDMQHSDLEKETTRISERSDITVERFKELLYENLYSSQRFNSNESISSDIKAVKRSFDKVIAEYENSREKKAPSFLSLE